MIPGLLRRAADEWGDSVWLRFEDRSFSFREMEERSNRSANLLRDIGVRKGDKVCLAVSNRPEFLDLWFGLAKLGGIMVPADPALMENEFAHLASHSDSTVLVMEDSAYRFVERQAGLLARFRVGIWIGDRRIPSGFLNYGETVTAFPRSLSRPAAPEPSDIMSIVYTPGTTGIPKGAILSQFHYRAAAAAWRERLVGAGTDDVYYAALPLSRVLTQTSTILGSLLGGRPTVLARGFDPSAFLEEVRRSGVTVFGCDAPMIAGLLRMPVREGERDHRVRLAFGESIPAAARREFEDRFGIGIVEAYQLTECAGICLATTGGSLKEGSIGKPLPCYDAMVVDDFDEEMPAGLSGEIVLRPRIPGGIFLGYYREHDRTAEHMRNGWFHTGDRGYSDADGDFYFLDRKGDSIRRGGEVFSSIEIERVVDSHPSVLESAATGVVSEIVDEDVRVFVVPRPGASLSKEDLIGWCADRLGPVLAPRYVEVVPELPKTASGRTMKSELRRRPLPSGQPA